MADQDTVSQESRIKSNGSGKNNTIFEPLDSYTCKGTIGTDYNYRHEVVWTNVIGMFILHALAGYGLFLLITGPPIKLYTFVHVLLVYLLALEGIGVGAHRYYTHRTFKAKPILRAILLAGHTVAGQNSMYVWCRNHRQHHLYSDTDADPHNARRGFFFSHIGWLITKHHPLVKKYRKNVDMSDLEADWMVMFQNKYYLPLYVMLITMSLAVVPILCYGESLKNCFFICFILPHVVGLHITLLVNSAAHMYGTRPYDAKLLPVESWFVSFFTCGEGWHNYHHAFPWDYRASELGMHFNFSAKVIKFLELIGLAWDLKTASPELVEKRILRTGDGTHYQLGTETARAAVTAVGIVHPFNPTYTTVTHTAQSYSIFDLEFLQYLEKCLSN